MNLRACDLEALIHVNIPKSECAKPVVRHRGEVMTAVWAHSIRWNTRRMSVSVSGFRRKSVDEIFFFF